MSYFSADINNSIGKPTYTQIILASSLGLIIAAAMHYRLKRIRDQKIVPHIKIADSGQPLKLERFSHYVARQMGFGDRKECPQLCKLASDYIRKTEECEENIYAFFANDIECDSLFIKMVEEIERCILSYFAFHWTHAPQDDSQCTDVMVPMAHKDRSPVLLFMGGGMGAGKSTVLSRF